MTNEPNILNVEELMPTDEIKSIIMKPEKVVPVKKKKTGRPRVVINYELAKNLAFYHCSEEEIATACGVSLPTLRKDKKFREIQALGKDSGKIILRKMQWEIAKNNQGMLQFLGKNILGQTDKQEIENKGTIVISIGKETEDLCK